ncbi:hypothetical protein [Flavobacterium sp. JAS]|uniref:hypothetical protein n=1 Tax=Flavobacterium sp. JAS TaxID=2897329 RepID=UPI001E5C6D60|nr:hypothetical protein [Flavobacterium sp. JAS]MCD0470188.1 hypothetical protein [Flavobacterium sp. JAS]
MKVIRIIFLVFFLVFANVFIAKADSTHPGPPDSAVEATAEGDPGNPGDNVPIDQNLVFLMIAGFALGGVFIYKNKIKQASI